MRQKNVESIYRGYIDVDLQQLSTPHRPISMLVVYKEKSRGSIYRLYVVACALFPLQPACVYLGGDPAAGSPTATLLRLLPPREA
jgi:hypothetical protein